MPPVRTLPKSIDDWVARLKLGTMAIAIEKLTAQQKKYLSSFDIGA